MKKVTLSLELDPDEVSAFAFIAALLEGDVDYLETYGEDVVKTLGYILDVASDNLSPFHLEDLSEQLERVSNNIRKG